MKMLTLCLSTAILHAAEPQRIPVYDINGTKLAVYKGDISRFENKVGLMALGRNGQRLLREPDFGDNMEVGRIYGPYDHVMVRHKDDESASDDDTHKTYDLSGENEFYKKAKKQTMSSNCVIAVVEPRILETISYNEDDKAKNVYSYCPARPVIGQQNHFTQPRFTEERAFAEAKKDVALCCQNVLNKGLALLTNEGNREIAIEALGSHVGVPRKDVAAAMTSALVNFAIEHPQAYKMIHIVVKKRSELLLYQNGFDLEISKRTNELLAAMEQKETMTETVS
jgi:hypothetical protein